MADSNSNHTVEAIDRLLSADRALNAEAQKIVGDAFAGDYGLRVDGHNYTLFRRIGGLLYSVNIGSFTDPVTPREERDRLYSLDHTAFLRELEQDYAFGVRPNLGPGEASGACIRLMQQRADMTSGL